MLDEISANMSSTFKQQSVDKSDNNLKNDQKPNLVEGQQKITKVVQEMKRQGRKAVSLKYHRQAEDDCGSNISCRHSMSDASIIKHK